MATERRGVLRRNPDFARLYLAAIISYMGDWFSAVALLGLVLETTGSASLAGLMLASSTLPYGLMSIFGGVIADRVDRRKLMIVADVLRAVVALGLLGARSEETIWIAFMCNGLIAAISPLFEPASSAAMPNLVRTEDLARANVLMGSAWGTMLAVGAAIGGVVSTALGRETAFVLNAASFIASALLIASIRSRFQEEREAPEHHVTIVSDIVAAVRFAHQETRILAILVVKGLFGLSGGTIALLSVMGFRVFGRGDTGIGILMGARGLGALIGPFLWRRFMLRGQDDRLMRSIGAAMTMYAVCYGLFAGAPNIWLAAAAVCGAHMGGGANWTMSAYAIQRFTPDHIRGRIFAFDYALITLTMAAAMTLAGFIAEQVSPRAVVLGFAAWALAGAIAWTPWASTLAARRQRRLVRAQ